MDFSPRFAYFTLVMSFAAWAGDTRAASTREMTTDRPDTTETPFTVEPGLMQLEASVASWTRDRQGGTRTTEWEWAPFNLRIGVAKSLEAGIVITPHIHRSEQVHGGAKTTSRGVGDTVLRGKVNFWGNDGGPTGFGLIADVKLPTAADGIGNDRTELALSFPFSFEVGLGWDGAAMTVIERVYTDAGKYEAAWTNTFSVARDLGRDTGCFLELASTAGDGRHVLLFNVGATHRLGATLQLDAGLNIGISKTAPDLGAFAGVSRRF